MKTEKIITHTGTVERIESDTVYVRITANSACGACRAREACGMGEAQEKVIAVRTAQPDRFAVGEAVTVGVKRRMGGLAVVLAYVGALVVLLGVLATAIGWVGIGEGPAALAALAAVGIYYGTLWLFRRKIENTIQFTITKQ